MIEFSIKSVLEEVKTECESSEALLGQLCDGINLWLDLYHQGKIHKVYQSKSDRLEVFKVEDMIENTAINILFATLMLEENSLQAYCGFLANAMKYHDDEWLSVRTSAECISALDGVIYDIKAPSRWSGETYMITPKVSVSTELKSKIEKCFFLPPSLTPLDDWTSNYDGGYDFTKDYILLGDYFNRHEYPLNRRPLNILQRVGYVLNPVVDTPELPKEGIDLEEFARVQKQARKVYGMLKDKEFYFVFQYDKRGRIYSKGYDVNPQGNEYRKAILSFSRKEKLTERGLYWLKVDLANHYGLDKALWSERIEWFNNNIDDILSDSSKYISKADSPLLFQRTLLAYRDYLDGKPIGHIVHLDATTSGPQIMSILSRDERAMKLFNVLEDEKRFDYYTLVAEEVYRRCPDSELWKDVKSFKEIREPLKKAIMTTYYNSKHKPEEIFGKGSKELAIYYDVLDRLTSGAMALLKVLNKCFDGSAFYHKWTLPDGHTAYCPVSKVEKKRIELHEIRANPVYQITLNKPNPEEKRSLAPNVIHSIDAYIMRAIVEKLDKKGIQVSPIHDSFGVHPNYCDELRFEYRNLLAELYSSNVLTDLIDELSLGQVKINLSPALPEITQQILGNVNGYYIC